MNKNSKIIKTLWPDFTMLLILFALAFGIYFESLSYGYVLDDVIVYSENSFVQKGFGGIWDILSKESFSGYFGEQKDLVAGARYRPLSLVSFALDFQFFGNKPQYSHMINIILYALTAFVLFRLVLVLRIPSDQSKWSLLLAVLSSILFVTHPIHSEAVANIKGRDEIMSLLFSIAALLSWLHYYDSKKTIHFIFALCWFTLGLFSKENAITFAAVIPLSMYFFRGVQLKNAIKQSWPLYLCAIFFVLVRWQVIGYFLSSGTVITDLMNNPFVGMSFPEKMATIFYTILWYFKLLIFPHPLTHDYYPYHVPKADWTNIISICSLILSFALLYFAYKKRTQYKIASFSILYYFITFSIVSNVFFPVGTFMNERFVYMPSIAFSILTAYGFVYAYYRINQKWKYVIPVIFLGVITAYGAKTIDRVPDWKDGFTLNLSAVKVSKNSARINLFTGVSYFQKSQIENDLNKKFELLKIAENYIDVSLRIFPNYGQALNMKAGILAEWLKYDNDVLKFLQKLESVIRIKPDLDFVSKYMEYLNKDPDNLSFMFPYLKKVGYEILYKEERNYKFALHFLGMAFKLNGDDAELCYFIGKVYSDTVKFGKLPSNKIKEYESNAQNFYQRAASLDSKYAF